MHKIWLITKREYLVRVKNKAFLLTTILAPIGMILFFGALGFVMNQGSDNAKQIQVLDPSGLLQNDLDVRDNLTFNFTNQSKEELNTLYKNKKIDGYLEIAPLVDINEAKYDVNYYSDDQLAIDESQSISRAIRKRVRNFKLVALDIDESKLNSLDTDVTIVPKNIFETKEVSSMTAIVGSILGGVVGYAMFFIILIYGSQVMRSVMEEKISRIVEVLISSVKPFQLMMGKVLGVGLVGLTQIGIWAIIFPIIFAIGSYFVGIDTTGSMPINPDDIDPAIMNEGMNKMLMVMKEISALNWWLITPLLLFYFLGGYFAYAALFAAVGSAVGEDINEAQSLTLPIMLPLIFATYIGFSAVQAPDSTMVVWASMIPLLSSIVMPVRLPAGPAAWEIIVSVVLLIVFVVFFVWLAGRIYRVGILMYGKKASLKEIGKWIFYKV